MKKRLYIVFVSVGMLWGIFLTSCITKAPDEPQVAAEQKIISPVKSNKLMEIKVRFVGFELDEAPHFTFQDGLDKLWEFSGDEEKYFNFGQKLPKEEVNAENQGWTSNPNLVGKWFLIRYVRHRKPEAKRGEPAESLVITRATLLRSERDSLPVGDSLIREVD